jgi:CubicO group peptidase (beta-lactamase class C family)
MKFTIITTSYLILLVNALFAQDADSLHEKTLYQFIESYNNRQYENMRETFGGPLKLILNEKRLEQMYGGMHEQLGSARIAWTKWKSSSVKVGLIYERDTTEYLEIGFSFSKKSRIIGLGSSSPKYKYDKRIWEPMNESDKIRIDSLMDLKHLAAGFSGCIAVIEDGNVVYESCRGDMTYPNGLPLTPQTPFEIASCSKAFTAAVIALLEQQGKLQYNDDITQHIPELKKYKGTTIEQLIHHTSGLPDYMELFDKYWDKTKIAGNADLVQLLTEHHPKKYFKSGDRYEYCNTGYVLLAVIAERVTGLAFGDAIKQELFSKADLNSAFLYNFRRAGKETKSNYAYGYIRDFKNNSHQLPDSIPSYDYVRYLDGITGDGMVNICVHDMVKWDKMLREPGLLSEKSIQKIFTSGKTKKGELTNYGFGWEINEKEGFERYAEHSGSWPGYTSYVLRFLDQKRAVVIFSNNEYMYLMQLAHQIAALSR